MRSAKSKVAAPPEAATRESNATKHMPRHANSPSSSAIPVDGSPPKAAESYASLRIPWDALTSVAPTSARACLCH